MLPFVHPRHLFTYHRDVLIRCVCMCVIFLCNGSSNKLIWRQCVSAIDPCVSHLVGTHSTSSDSCSIRGLLHTTNTQTYPLKLTLSILHACLNYMKMDFSTLGIFPYFKHSPLFLAVSYYNRSFLILFDKSKETVAPSCDFPSRVLHHA